MRVLIKQSKRFLKSIYSYLVDYIISRNSLVKIYNYRTHNINVFKPSNVNENWLVKFILNKNILNNITKTIGLFSVNGEKLAVILSREDYKIFYTIENVHVEYSHWKKFEDLYLNNSKINLSLGYDYLKHDSYIRFPYWLMTFFSPEVTLDEINMKLNSISNQIYDYKQRSKFCSFICRNDYFGDRSYFADLVSTIGTLNYPSQFRNNDIDLFDKYNDNKKDYLGNFKFNLCPENSNNSGYVTEKIFDAIEAGCIPIYWGSDNLPEINILNQNRILFLKLNDDNSKIIAKIQLLNENEILYNDFVKQPVFNDNAAEIIYSFYSDLESKLKSMIIN